MLSKTISNANIYIEFYSLGYLTILTLGVLVFSINSSYNQKNFIYLSDISTFSRFKILSLILFFFFCLVGGIPPFLTFVTKFYVFSFVSGSAFLFFILTFIMSLLVYYLSVFKFLRVDFNYSRLTEFISFNATYTILFFLFFNLIASYSIHVLALDII